MDIGLPDINGYELLSQLKQFKELETATFIALTGFEEDGARPGVIGVDFDYFLRKPLDTSQIRLWCKTRDPVIAITWFTVYVRRLL